MNENMHSFAERIIGQREQGTRSEEVCNASGLTQAQRQAVEKLEAEPIQHGTDSADTLEYLMASQNTLQLPRQGISRRTAMLRLAGLVVGGMVGSSLVLLSCSQQPATSAAQASPAVSPTSISTSTPALLPVGMTLYTYRRHSSSVEALAWSPDGKRIASCSIDGTVQVWDAADGGHVYTYRGHTQNHFGVVEGVWTVSWSPNGLRIASGGDDTTVQVWDAASGTTIYTYRGHFGTVQAVTWSPDGKRLASASDDGTVQVWNAP